MPRDTADTTDAEHAPTDAHEEDGARADAPDATVPTDAGDPGDSGDASETSSHALDPGPPPLAEFAALAKDYGDHHALGPITLTLEPGCIGLLGPNGAGKSTLIRMMMGLLAPSSGSVRVLGEDVRPGAVGVRRRIGYAPEGDARFPEMTGVASVAYAGRLVGMDRASSLERAHQVLDYVGLGEARYRVVDTYSTGMRQRLKIAQALVHDPELLILDEPTEGVDPEAREHILELIAELVREHGLQLILSTHLLHDVERVATHALIVNQGHVVEHGPIESLRTARRRGYQVRVNASPEPLMARLDRAGLAYDVVPPALRVATQDPVEILRHVAEAGLVVRHLAPVELSLNEIFEEALNRPDEPAPEEGADDAPETSASPTESGTPATEATP